MTQQDVCTCVCQIIMLVDEPCTLYDHYIKRRKILLNIIKLNNINLNKNNNLNKSGRYETNS